MNYDIKAKPTIYNGRNYRSRLEAKWQCMFNKLGWITEYEPSQINGYNPDFIIQCSSDAYPTNTIIVEVKPSVFIDKDYIDSVYKKYDKTKAHILILSDMPFNESRDHKGLLSIGIGSQFFQEPYERSDMNCLQMKCFNDMGSNLYQFDGMVYGKIERKNFLYVPDEMDDFCKIMMAWVDSGNETQFKV